MITPGRPKKVYDKDLLQLIYRDYHTMTGQQVADKYHVSLSTVRRYIRMMRQQEDTSNEPETHEIHI